MHRRWAGCVVVGGLWAGSVLADTPPANGVRAPAPPPASREQGQPDDSFLEFLGRDDVEDARWWEFFRRQHPHPRDAGGEQAPQAGERS